MPSNADSTPPDPARLRWQCRRGTRELDLLLQGYLEHRFPEAPASEQRVFCRLLALEDPELSDLIFHGQPEEPHTARVIRQLRQYR